MEELITYNFEWKITANYFKGEAWVTDDDLELDFSGEVDFSKDKPVMDFVANVVEADLLKLICIIKDLFRTFKFNKLI